MFAVCPYYVTYALEVLTEKHSMFFTNLAAEASFIGSTHALNAKLIGCYVIAENDISAC